MRKINAGNERIKRDYLRFQKEARGKSDATLDAIRKSIDRFEDATGGKDFKTFRREQAIAFKERLAGTAAKRSGSQLSAATLSSTLTALKEFFVWLAWQPGFKSKIHVPDIDYFSPSRQDSAKAKASRLPDFPSLEQINAVLAVMPVATVVDRRNRALIAFTILTGIRDRALASLSLRSLDMTATPPRVDQNPNEVQTKFGKTITTYFLPLGDHLHQIVADWIHELKSEHLFGPGDPIFPRTKVVQGKDQGFRSGGIERSHWANASPIRDIFRKAFTAAGLRYFAPHSFRHTIGHLMQTTCRTPEQIKAWSQNLGHENIATTMTSYGRMDPYRQGEVIACMAGKSDEAKLNSL